jgi:hypothetical protein
MIQDGQVARLLALLLCQRVIASPYLRLGHDDHGLRQSLFEAPALRIAPFHFGHIGDLRHRGRISLPVMAENKITHLAPETLYGRT